MPHQLTLLGPSRGAVLRRGAVKANLIHHLAHAGGVSVLARLAFDIALWSEGAYEISVLLLATHDPSPAERLPSPRKPRRIDDSRLSCGCRPLP